MVSPLLRRHNVRTVGTLRPNAGLAVVLRVFDKEPRSRDTLAAMRTATEGRFVGVHGKGTEEPVTSSFQAKIHRHWV